MDLSHSMEIKWQEWLLRHSQIISHASPVPRLAQNTHNPVLYGEGGGAFSKEHYTYLQPHHRVTMLTCSSNNLSTLSNVFRRLRCVQRSDWGLAFRSLHESKLINVSFFFFLVVLFCLFFGAWQFCPRFATIKGLELRPVLLSKPSKNVDKQIPEWNLLVPGCVCL